MEVEAIDTRRIIELLRYRHPPPDWAAFAELRGGTGYINLQHLDFFAMHLWPSKDFHSIAYEVKVSRADFARELKNPRKRAFAESVAMECNFVVPHGLVEPAEVPEGWGLIVANAGGLKRVKMPTQRRVKPNDWPPEFIASIARRVADEPSSLPQAAWKVAGREVSEKELLSIAEEKFKQTVEQACQDADARAREKLRESGEYQRLAQLERAVWELTGYQVHDAAGFRRWFGSIRPVLTPEQQRAIRQGHMVLGELLTSLEQEEASGP